MNPPIKTSPPGTQYDPLFDFRFIVSPDQALPILRGLEDKAWAKLTCAKSLINASHQFLRGSRRKFFAAKTAIEAEYMRRINEAVRRAGQPGPKADLPDGAAEPSQSYAPSAF